MCPLSYQGETVEDQLTNAQLLESGEFPLTPISVSLLGTKLVVFNNIHGSLLYGYGRYFGIPTGIRKPRNHIFDRPLELTLFEGVYLLKHKKIAVRDHDSSGFITFEDLYALAETKFPEFTDKYLIYEDLRNKKYIPRPGQKFGADFIVYRQGPGIDHSSFCIQVLSKHTKISSIDVVRSARLATSVKKRFILANPVNKSYFSFKWFKP
ncbi:tRNA-splicing endonuclease [Candidatus Lokiarchaeum ossiferum]|uniref:tRNA-splicing endonuclease n=1 Tax=Candidatus Lokiarchaeum ossiferum TaxID=2951803 RepID=A0ABY6HWF6_9ARCH|nr:tRNA-splicing endonuclease [Candidatus Lokiarchaeum sp. B-35]